MINATLNSLHGRRSLKTSIKRIFLLSIFHATLFSSTVLFTSTAEANGARYQPTNHNETASKFYSRYGSQLINIQYIRADIFGIVNKAKREGRDALQDLDEYVVTNASGSVFVLPGVNADQLYIYNDGSGNPIAIKR